MFLDERGHRGLIVRLLGVVGAVVSAGALAFIVIGALAFTHVSPSRDGAPTIVPVTLARPSAAPRERSDLASEGREPKDKRDRA